VSTLRDEDARRGVLLEVLVARERDVVRRTMCGECRRPLRLSGRVAYCGNFRCPRHGFDAALVEQHGLPKEQRA
jgi:hypothetical protein